VSAGISADCNPGSISEEARVKYVTGRG